VINGLIFLGGINMKENEEMLPKVSILITTYNRPYYFELALQSSLNQTYKNIEIIICDNSENNETKKTVGKYIEESDKIIRYFKNSNNIGPQKNKQNCYDLATGEYINYLMDDDLFHPQKIEKMMPYFINNKNITLVTSHRQKIDEKGLFLPPLKKLYEEDVIIDGIELGDFMLKNKLNCIGQPTTVLFRKNDLEEPFGVFVGKQAWNNVDVASWLNLLAKGKAVYIPETLSYLRIHKGQLSNDLNSTVKNIGDWINHVLDSQSKGFLKNESDYIQAIRVIKSSILKYFHRISTKIKHDDKQPYLNELYQKLDFLIKMIENNQALVDDVKDFRSLLSCLVTVNQKDKEDEARILDLKRFKRSFK
jgi:glycosyltransferase involved in cell wall biosynthesis